MKYNLAVLTFLSVIIGFISAQANVQSFGRCITPNRERAICIHLDQCADLYVLLQKRPLSDEEKLYLRRSQCGYNNGKVLVCCPSRSISPVAVAPGPGRPTQTGGSGVPMRSSLLPQPGTCGNVVSDRIYGGNITAIDEYPWMALIEYSKPGNRKGHHCGGSLISNRYVVTASHCVNGKGLPTDWTLSGVRLGEWDTSTDRDCQVDISGNEDCSEPYVDVPVERTITHEQYDPDSKAQTNDIALLRLKRTVPYTDFIRPICLPTADYLKSAQFQGVKMDVAGWGKTERVSASNIKLKATVSGINLDECNSVYSRHSLVLEDSQICAGGDKGIDSCRGDSGGPLIGLDNSNKARTYYFLVGIVSFGPTPCGLEGWPGVYTRVGAFVDWIQTHIEP